jgi:hypothetical protein
MGQIREFWSEIISCGVFGADHVCFFQNSWTRISRAVRVLRAQWSIYPQGTTRIAREIVRGSGKKKDKWVKNELCKFLGNRTFLFFARKRTVCELIKRTGRRGCGSRRHNPFHCSSSNRTFYVLDWEKS